MGGVAQLYDALAPLYDDWQSCDGMVPFAEVVRAKLEPILRERAAGRPLAFLDVGCGTGTLLCGLRAQHPDWRLAGADGTAAMLAVAARKPAAGSILWARSALAAPLPFAGGFDAVGCFYDTLNHLTDAEALARAFAALAAVVRPGGLVIFDVTNEDGFPRWWRGCPTFDGEGWHMELDMRYDPDRQLGLAEVELDLAGRSPQWFPLVERLFEREVVEAALTGAGLDPIVEEPWAPFPAERTGKTWWMARRRA